MKTHVKQRFKPAGSVTILDKDRLATIYLYHHDGMPAAVCYRGRKIRPEVHITRTTQSELESTVGRWIDGLREQKRLNEQYRKQREQDEWSRNNVIGRIRTALVQRGFRYSVTGGHGTAWGWIEIDLLPSQHKILTPEKSRQAYLEMNAALGLRGSTSVSVPASTDYYREYIDRAEGRTPAKLGEPYWD